MKSNKIILSIESGIEGGSLSILKGSGEIDFWIGTKNVSRSEELLMEINALLIKNKIKKTEIGLIAVSNSEGSYTGIRIGLATALGLKKAFGCQIKGVSVLDAIAFSTTKKGTVISAVSINGRDIYMQISENLLDEISESKSKTELLDYAVFCRKIFGKKTDKLLVNDKLYEILREDKKLTEIDKATVFNVGKNLAKLIGRKAQELDASDNAKQVYIKEFK